MCGPFSTNGRDERCRKFLVGPEGKESLGRPRRRRQDNTKWILTK